MTAEFICAFEIKRRHSGSRTGPRARGLSATVWQPGPHPGQQNPAVSPPGFVSTGLLPGGSEEESRFFPESQRVRGVISGNKSLRKQHLPRLVCLPSLRPCGWTETESLSCPRKREGGIGDDSTAEASEGGPPAKPRTRRLLRGHSRLWGPQVPRAPEALSFKAVDTASRPWASRRCGDALPDVCDWRGNVQLTREGDRAPATFYSASRRPN